MWCGSSVYCTEKVPLNTFNKGQALLHQNSLGVNEPHDALQWLCTFSCCLHPLFAIANYLYVPDNKQLNEQTVISKNNYVAFLLFL